MRDRGFLWHTILSACLSLSFVLTRFSSVASWPHKRSKNDVFKACFLYLLRKRCNVTHFCALLCTEDDNSCYRNVCKMSVVSFALAVVFLMTRFCTLNRLTKILMRSISNVHAGRRFPTPILKYQENERTIFERNQFHYVNSDIYRLRFAKNELLFISAILVSGTFSPYNERKQDLSKNEPKLTSLHDTGQFFRYHEK